MQLPWQLRWPGITYNTIPLCCHSRSKLLIPHVPCIDVPTFAGVMQSCSNTMYMVSTAATFDLMHADCIIVCTGCHFSGTFHSCTFVHSAVYAVHGARIVLHGCTMSNAPQGQKVANLLPALTLSGEATLATLIECRVRFCLTAFVVDGGAALVASECEVRDADTAMVVCGAGGFSALDSCSIRGQAFGSTLCGQGISVRRGALSLRRCTIEEFDTAVCGSGAATRVDMHEVQVMNCVHALRLERHAVAAARDCVLKVRTSEGVRRQAETIVLGAHSRVVARTWLQMERMHLQAAGRCALDVGSGGGAAASLCRFEGPSDILACVISEAGGKLLLSECDGAAGDICVMGDGPAARVRVRGGRYEGSSALCIGQQKAVVSAADAEFYGVHSRPRRTPPRTDQPQDRGLFELIDASGWLHRCRFRNGNVGVFTTDSTLTAVDVSVTGMLATASGRDLVQRSRPNSKSGYRSIGYTLLGGGVTVRGGVIDQCVHGVMGQRGGPGTRPVSLEGLVVRDCVTGVNADLSCELAISRCEFLGPQRERGSDPPVDLRNPHVSLDESAAIRMHDTTSGTFTQCVLQGSMYGLASWSTGNFAVKDCEFKMQVVGGCGLLTKSDTTIQDCRFAGPPPGPTARAAVQGVKSGGGKCELRRCCFDDVTNDAIVAAGFEEAVTMTIVDTKVRRCDTGLSMFKHASVAVQDFDVDVEFRGINMDGGDLSAKRLTVRGGDEAIHAWCDEGPATVKIVDSTLSGARLGVAAVGHQTKFTMLRGLVQTMDIAAEFRAGAIGRVKGTHFLQCEQGVQVGDVMGAVLGSGSQCPMCGMSGQRAAGAAFKKLGESGGKGFPGARCVHAGAVSRVTMADVNVDCGKDAVSVHNHGYLDATRVIATQCDFAFFLRYNTVRSSFVECKAVDCGAPGVSMARPDHGIEQPAKVMKEIEVVKTRERVSEAVITDFWVNPDL